jgi:hypothetical protein
MRRFSIGRFLFHGLGILPNDFGRFRFDRLGLWRRGFRALDGFGARRWWRRLRLLLNDRLRLHCRSRAGHASAGMFFIRGHHRQDFKNRHVFHLGLLDEARANQQCQQQQAMQTGRTEKTFFLKAAHRVPGGCVRME